MAYINQWNVSGNVGRDAELKTTKNGMQYADFNLAINTKGQGEDGDETMWVRVSLFGKSAERAVEFCKKGSNVFVTGPLKKRRYVKRDGTEAVEDTISTNNFTMLRYAPYASNEQVYAERKNKPDNSEFAAPGVDFDLPF